MEALAVYTTDIELLTYVMCVVVHCVSSSCFVLSQFFGVVHTQVGQSHDQCPFSPQRAWVRGYKLVRAWLTRSDILSSLYGHN